MSSASSMGFGTEGAHELQREQPKPHPASSSCPAQGHPSQTIHLGALEAQHLAQPLGSLSSPHPAYQRGAPFCDPTGNNWASSQSSTFFSPGRTWNSSAGFLLEDTEEFSHKCLQPTRGGSVLDPPAASQTQEQLPSIPRTFHVFSTCQSFLSQDKLHFLKIIL